MVDVNYPAGGRRLGAWAARPWIPLGDIIRDTGPLFDAYDFEYEDSEVDGFGSLHLYIAWKRPCG